MVQRGAIPLLDAAGARAGDAAAVEAGDTWAALMDRAAGHLARGIVAAGGHGYGLRVAILVGKGNNGGDGWAAACRLREHGAMAWVVAVDGRDVEVSDEAAANRAAWLTGGGRTSDGLADLDAALAWCDVAVDALLGTGTRGAPRGSAGAGVAGLRRAHASGTIVVACDIPTGVDADDGAAAPDAAVVADLTITFGGVKRGLLLHPGAAHAGRVLVGDLGPRYDPGGTTWEALTPAGAAPSRFDAATDKRGRGTALVVAGAVGTSGAAALAATGALRVGAGLVTVAVPAPVRADVAVSTDPGVMARALPADEQGGVDAAAVHAMPNLDAVDVVVAGPGLGHGPGAAAVVAALRRDARRLVLDADALNVHRDAPEALGEHRGELVLTPHEREFARIGGGHDGHDAWSHRVERAPALARSLDATIVVKGPGTIVAAPDGRVWVCPLGGPELGSGGTGDALAGIVGAAIATADDVPLAVAQAVWWHAAAGEAAGRRAAGRATATGLLAELPTVLAELLAWAGGPGSGASSRAVASTGSGAASRGVAGAAPVWSGAAPVWSGAAGGGPVAAGAGGLPWDTWRMWHAGRGPTDVGRHGPARSSAR